MTQRFYRGDGEEETATLFTAQAAPSETGGVATPVPKRVTSAPSGNELKFRGIAKAFVHRPEALAKVRRAAERAADVYTEITAEDVWMLACPSVSRTDFGYLIGGIFAADDWEKVRQVRAQHPEAHSRLIWVWRKRRT